MLRRIFGIYAFLLFVVTFLLLWPFFWITLLSPKTHYWTHQVYRLWTRIVFGLCGVRFQIEYKEKLDPQKTYVYCVNHTSYTDIPTMYFATQGSIAFIGKSALGKAPLFGYIYKKLHVLVDRKSLKSKKESYEQCLIALDKGIHVVIFPEGTISQNGHPPLLLPFKDGAFKMAIEKQKEIIPVTLAYNWIILPDDGKWLPKAHVCKIILHKPIPTLGLDMLAVQTLKNQVFQTIQQEFLVQNKITS